jgi:hypothetical protein
MPSVIDIWNTSLRRIGYATPVANPYEGSRASRVLLNVYGATRDDTLRAFDWPFAERFSDLVLNGQTAPSPWNYEYSYPSDCLKIRDVIPGSATTWPNYDPVPVLFTNFNDSRINEQAILATMSSGTLVYTGRVTDPDQWDANFIDALIEALARRVAVGLAGSVDLVQLQQVISGQATQEALDAQANAPPLPTVPMNNARARQ